MGTHVEFDVHKKSNIAAVMTSFPKVQFAAFNSMVRIVYPAQECPNWYTITHD